MLSPPCTTRWPTASISLHGGDDAVLRIDQGVQHSLDGFGMGGHGHINGVQLLLAVHLGLVGELAVDADPLAQALGQQRRQ